MYRRNKVGNLAERLGETNKGGIRRGYIPEVREILQTKIN